MDQRAHACRCSRERRICRRLRSPELPDARTIEADATVTILPFPITTAMFGESAPVCVLTTVTLLKTVPVVTSCAQAATTVSDLGAVLEAV